MPKMKSSHQFYFRTFKELCLVDRLVGALDMQPLHFGRSIFNNGELLVQTDV